MHQGFSLIDIECFKDGKKMPIYLWKHPDMKEIFNTCIGGINDRMICQKLPLWVNRNAAFILKQNTYCICHPFDLQADNISGSFKRSEKVRLYECSRNNDGLLTFYLQKFISEKKGKTGSVVLWNFELLENGINDMKN